MQRKVALWKSRVLEYEQKEGIWHFAAPGVKGSVWPPEAEVPPAMDRSVPLMLHDILMVEILLQEQLPQLLVEKYGDHHMLPPQLSNYHRNYEGFLDRGGFLQVRVKGQAESGLLRREIKPVPVLWKVWINVPFSKAFDLE